ncbi:MAG TPA: hypothetical protein VEU06_10045 [Micropepsaceae bacterium]|nr:hypothetical protein [Micropepsaceae bacterium]
MRELMLLTLGVLAFCMGAYAIMATLRSGTARLRGGRKVTRAKNPALYWTNVVALGVLMGLSLVLIGIALYR